MAIQLKKKLKLLKIEPNEIHVEVSKNAYLALLIKKKKIKFIDGPNLNLLGKPQPEIYAFETLDDIHKLVKSHINENL